MANAGLNRFAWDLRYPDAVRFPGLIMWAGQTQGPKAVPGTYQVKLTVDGKTETQTLVVKKDPRIETSNEEFAKQFDLLIQIRDKLSQMHRSILEIRDARKQIDDIAKRASGESGDKAIADAAKSLKEKLTAVEQALYQTQNRASEDPLNYPIRLNNKLAALGGVVASSDAAPTAQDYTIFQNLVPAIDAELAKLEQIKREDVVAFNKLVRDRNVPAVVIRNRTDGK
jgi:hypothetical protein